jgi:hypothetical protein
MHMRTSISLCVTALALHAGPWLNSAVVTLSNGDRLSGEPRLAADGNQIQIAHPLLGTIPVPSAAVSSIDGVATAAWIAAQSAPLPGAPVAAAPTDPAPVADVAPAALTGTDDDDAASADQRRDWRRRFYSSALLNTLDWLNPLKDWKSKLTVGYTWRSEENSNHDFLFLYEADRKRDLSEWKLGLRWDYGTVKIGDNPQQVREDKYRANLQYRRTIWDHFFVQSRSQYQKDIVRLIDHDIDQSLGIGWWIYRGKDVRVSFLPSYTLRYREINGLVNNFVSMVTLTQDFSWKITRWATFTEEAAMSFEPHDLENSDYRLTLKLENKISDRLSLDFRYEYTFEYTVGVGIDKKAQRFISALGYRF